MVKEVFVISEGKVKIAINHYNSSQRKSVIIICPGFFMSKDARPFREMSEDFFKYFDVITMDFRGHGKSSGLFTFTACEPEDLRAVIKYAKDLYPKIGVLGFSLGAAIAIIDIARNKDIHSLIAVSAPTDFRKIENKFLNKDALVPAMHKFEFGVSFDTRMGNMFLKKIKPIDVIGKIEGVPLLLIAGQKDPIVYPWHAEKLYEIARDPKSITKFKNGLHAEELYLKNKDEFVKICKDWFIQALN